MAGRRFGTKKGEIIIQEKKQRHGEAPILAAYEELKRLDQLVRDYSDAISDQADSAAVLTQMSESLRKANEILEGDLPKAGSL